MPGETRRNRGTRFANSAPMPVRLLLSLALATVASLCLASNARAQQEPGQPGPDAAAPAQAAAQPPEEPAWLQGRELDEVLVNLPTTLALKKHKSYFRITHRFARDLRRGTFGQLAEDAFSLDSGAIIGLEYRFALTDSLQAGVNRSILGKTIDIFGRFDGWQQSASLPVGISPLISIEGQNNLRVDPQPGASVTFSRVQGRFALYATPTFVKDAHTPTLRVLHEGHEHTAGEEDSDADAHEDANDTAFLGLGARVHLLETVSVVGEVSPRIYGYTPDRALWSVGIEKLTHGHVLQLNFSNSFGTTPGQIARGGSPHDVYLGFNLSRKF
jgi:hypothetical protein